MPRLPLPRGGAGVGVAPMAKGRALGKRVLVEIRDCLAAGFASPFPELG